MDVGRSAKAEYCRKLALLLKNRHRAAGHHMELFTLVCVIVMVDKKQPCAGHRDLIRFR
jgi:hypothetical protein